MLTYIKKSERMLVSNYTSNACIYMRFVFLPKASKIGFNLEHPGAVGQGDVKYLQNYLTTRCLFGHKICGGKLYMILPLSCLQNSIVTVNTQKLLLNHTFQWVCKHKPA